jgi:hypothetical protein
MCESALKLVASVSMRGSPALKLDLENQPQITLSVMCLLADKIICSPDYKPAPSIGTPGCGVPNEVVLTALFYICHCVHSGGHLTAFKSSHLSLCALRWPPWKWGRTRRSRRKVSRHRGGRPEVIEAAPEGEVEKLLLWLWHEPQQIAPAWIRCLHWCPLWPLRFRALEGGEVHHAACVLRGLLLSFWFYCFFGRSFWQLKTCLVLFRENLRHFALLCWCFSVWKKQQQIILSAVNFCASSFVPLHKNTRNWPFVTSWFPCENKCSQIILSPVVFFWVKTKRVVHTPFSAC